MVKEKKVNMNSVIIYLLMGLLILFYFTNGSLAFIGMTIGMLFVYFVLANKKEKENIRNNLLFRIKKDHDKRKNKIINVKINDEKVNGEAEDAN